MDRVRPEDLYGEEWAAWFRLTPEERFRQSMEMWETYLALGGSLAPDPDPQSPSSIRKNGARTLLMGGQACVFYGAAEFSKILDLVLVADEPTMAALDELGARSIAVPPFA